MIDRAAKIDPDGIMMFKNIAAVGGVSFFKAEFGDEDFSDGADTPKRLTREIKRT
jgi:hypothetical protein